MSHTYATVADLKSYIVDGGSTGTANDALFLSTLESVSAAIDDRAERSAYGSGFGPRTGTNRYDAAAGKVLRLRDDLLTVTSITIRLSTAASSTTTLVAETDYYLLGEGDAYGQSPYRKILLHGQGTTTAFGTGYRVTDVAGTWGYSNTTSTAAATASAIASTTTTSVTVSAGAEFSPGQTILIDSEQLYISAVSGTTLTVKRGQNGTTAATHSNGAAIAIYQYPSEVKETCLRVALRRWKTRDAGASGLIEGVGLSTQASPEGEDTIIRRGLFGLRLKEMV